MVARLGSKAWLLFLQGLTSGGDVRPVLLGSPQTLNRFKDFWR
jgi:hypothetical protein